MTLAAEPCLCGDPECRRCFPSSERAPTNGLFDSLCRAYISSIRNANKRNYAHNYWQFRRVAEGVMCPDDGAISYMAGQAVRLRIEELWRAATQEEA